MKSIKNLLDLFFLNNICLEWSYRICGIFYFKCQKVQHHFSTFGIWHSSGTHPLMWNIHLGQVIDLCSSFLQTTRIYSRQYFYSFRTNQKSRFDEIREWMDNEICWWNKSSGIYFFDGNDVLSFVFSFQSQNCIIILLTLLQQKPHFNCCLFSWVVNINSFWRNYLCRLLVLSGRIK